MRASILFLFFCYSSNNWLHLLGMISSNRNGLSVLESLSNLGLWVVEAFCTTLEFLFKFHVNWRPALSGFSFESTINCLGPCNNVHSVGDLNWFRLFWVLLSGGFCRGREKEFGLLSSVQCKEEHSIWKVRTDKEIKAFDNQPKNKAHWNVCHQ
jgi:hypothetical protein